MTEKRNTRLCKYLTRYPVSLITEHKIKHERSFYLPDQNTIVLEKTHGNGNFYTHTGKCICNFNQNARNNYPLSTYPGKSHTQDGMPDYSAWHCL